MFANEVSKPYSARKVLPGALRCGNIGKTAYRRQGKVLTERRVNHLTEAKVRVLTARDCLTFARGDEPGALELGHCDLDVSRCGREAAGVMPRPVGLAVGRAPVALRVHEQVRLLVEQRVDGVLCRLFEVLTL